MSVCVWSVVWYLPCISLHLARAVRAYRARPHREPTFIPISSEYNSNINAPNITVRSRVCRLHGHSTYVRHAHANKLIRSRVHMALRNIIFQLVGGIYERVCVRALIGSEMRRVHTHTHTHISWLTAHGRHIRHVGRQATPTARQALLLLLGSLP